jgi:formate-dependent nitrite reductase membrane component NrfD
VSLPSASVPWGPWIGVYIVLTGLASGLTLAARFHRPNSERAAIELEWISSWIAIAVLAICSMILIEDLGRPMRFFLMVTQFANGNSLMSWGAKIITLKIMLLGVYLFFLQRRRQALLTGDERLDGATRTLHASVVDALGLTSFALAIYPAFLLSRTWSSPASHNAGSALVYLSSGVLLGAAAIDLIATFAPGVVDRTMGARAKVSFLHLLAPHIVAVAFFLLSLRDNTTRTVFNELLHGTWTGVCRIWFIATGVALLLSVPVFKGASRIVLSIAVLIVAAMSRYLIFAVH